MEAFSAIRMESFDVGVHVHIDLYVLKYMFKIVATEIYAVWGCKFDVC